MTSFSQMIDEECSGKSSLTTLLFIVIFAVSSIFISAVSSNSID